MADPKHNERMRSFEAESAQGRQSLTSGDYATAKTHFTRAHALGHDSKMCHLRAHYALLRVAWRQRSPAAMASQFGLLILAAIFG